MQVLAGTLYAKPLPGPLAQCNMPRPDYSSSVLLCVDHAKAALEMPIAPFINAFEESDKLPPTCLYINRSVITPFKHETAKSAVQFTVG